MASDVLVSVYLPTRNRETLLRRAVDSVLDQTYPSIELIVVNDGSSDETFDYLEALARRDPRVEVIHNASSLGAPRSRNLAIQAARGEFVTGLDDDDRFHPERIGELVQHWRIIERAGEPFSCLFTQDVIENGTGEVGTSKPGTVEWRDLFFFNTIGNQVFARRQAFIDAGLFDDEMPAWQDVDLFIRILKGGGPAKLLDATLYFMNAAPRTDRISVGSKQRLLNAYQKLASKWRECPKVMLQGLYLQIFSEHYGYKPTLGDLVAFFRLGVHLRTLRRLAGVYCYCTLGVHPRTLRRLAGVYFRRR
jgi:glycosyltransferase involved in cell wall biosynthesis